MTVPWAYRPSVQSHEQICIVDDDDSVADSLKSLLETFGLDVRCYTSGAEFLADHRRGVAGCLLIDQHMPGLNGLDVVDHLQRGRSSADDPDLWPPRYKHQGARGELGSDERN